MSLAIANRPLALVLACASLIATVVACGPGLAPRISDTPSPSPTLAATPTAVIADTGPVDAVTRSYNSAVAGGLAAQLDFFSCVYGGAEANQFSELFTGLGLLALVSSGVDSQEFSSAFGTSFDGFEASETSRVGNTAVVHVRVTVTLAPDLDKLRELMGRGIATNGSTFDTAAIDAAIASLLGEAQASKLVEHDVDVVGEGEEWVACAP